MTIVRRFLSLIKKVFKKKRRRIRRRRILKKSRAPAQRAIRRVQRIRKHPPLKKKIIKKFRISSKSTIFVSGAKTNFSQVVRSLQIESVNVPDVRRGQLVGLKLDQPAREGDKIFKG